MEPSALKTYQSILDVLYTKSQATSFLKTLDALIEELYATKGSVEKRIEEAFPYEIKQAFITCAKENKINTEDPIQTKKFLVGLKKLLQSLPSVTMYIAFEPTEKNLKAISSWFVTKLSQKYLLDLHIKHQIIGGVIVEMNGLSKDYSLKNKINTLYRGKNILSFLEKEQKGVKR